MELDWEGFDSPVKVIASKESEHNETADDYEVEKIIGMRLVKSKLWFRVRWKGYGKDLATWEPRANLTHCEELLDDYVSKVQDKKYKQKKRRQTRNALIHTRKKEMKGHGLNQVVKNKVQTLNGNIKRKRFIKKFISKPNKYFTRIPQTKWRMNGGQLEMVNLRKPEELPLETRKEKKPKRGRGRPKKNPTKMPDLQPQTQLCPDREPLETVDDIVMLENNSTVDDIVMLENNSIPEQKVEAVVKRCRGRPPKKKITEYGEKLQNHLFGLERTKDIVKKRRKPKKGVVAEGATEETTHHLWKGQIKLKKVVIRELRSLKALLEFQRQISDEEKENQTETYHEDKNPSSMEHRHVLASEYHNRFYIRIKTGSFKDQSTKRRRKRKANKERRRKRKEAAHRQEQTSGDHEKNELLDKQRGCDELEEDEERGYDLPEVMEISSASEGENEDGDSVESQTDAPSLNEEYDQFGYDDFCDFSKDNNNVRDECKKIDAELPPVLEEREMDGGEIPGDENTPVELNNQQDTSNLRLEQLAEDDAVINHEEQEKMEEDEAVVDDESSSLVIPFDEEEESSSLILCDDEMEDDDDEEENDDDSGDDDEDDLREFDISNKEIQEPKPSAAMVFSTDSLDNRKKEIIKEMTQDDEEYGETGHCEESTEDGEFVIADKCRSKDTKGQQKEKKEKNLNGEENMSKILQSEGVHGNNGEDIANYDTEKDTVNKTIKSRELNLSEDDSKKAEKQESQIGTDVETAKDEERGKEDGNSSASHIPMETDDAVEESINENDKTKLNDEGPMRASQTPVVEKYTKEEDCAVAMMNSEIFSERQDKEAANLEENEEGASVEKMKEKCNETKGEVREGQGDQIELQVTILSIRKEVIEESIPNAKERETDMVCTQKTTEKENVERDHAMELINSKIHSEQTDDVGSKEETCIEQMEEKCKHNKEEERGMKDDLQEVEPPVMTLPKPTEMDAEVRTDDKEMPSDMKGPQESMEEETVEKNCAVETMNSEIFLKKMDEEKDGIEKNATEVHVCVEKMAKEFSMGEPKETKDDFIEPQVAVLSKCKELDGKAEADEKEIESEFAVTQETARKEVQIDEEVEPKKNTVLRRESEIMKQDIAITEESDKNDDHGEGDKENTKRDGEEMESDTSGAQENKEKELKTGEEAEHVKNDMPRGVVEIVKERGSKEKDDEEGDKSDQIEEKEGESYSLERKEESNEEERKPVLMLTKIKEIEGEPYGEEEMESEMASAQETIEKEFNLDEEVVCEKNDVSQRDSNIIKLDSTIAQETEKVEVDDQGEQDNKRTKTNEEEMETEIAGAHEITEKEVKMVEEVESENKMPQEECNNMKPKLTISKEREREEHRDQGEKCNEKHLEQLKNEETKMTPGISEATSKVVEDETDTGEKETDIGEKEEMEVEEREDCQMDSEKVTPGKDETEFEEGEDELDEVTKAKEEKIFTSSEENVKDQEICNEKTQEVYRACKDSMGEAAVTVAEEQRMECRDTEDGDVQGIPDLLVKEKDDGGCEKEECNNETSLAENEREAKSTKESKDGGKETKEGDRVDNGEEPVELEIPTANDNLHVHLVGAEKKGQSDESGGNGDEGNIEDILENNCIKDDNKEDREIINNAKTELGNDLLKEKRVEVEITESCHENMDDRDDALFKVTEKDVANKEGEKPIDPEIEIIDDIITDEQENKKQIPFLEKAENAKNKTNSNLKVIQEAVPKEKREIDKKQNGNSSNIQELSLLDKMEADTDEIKAIETGRADGVKMLEEEELEEGEIPEDEEKEEDDVVEEKDEDKEEGEITEETEDAVEERSSEGEETTPVSTDGLDSMTNNSVKDCSHSQKGEPLRRGGQEAVKIMETSKINSDYRTTQHDIEKQRTTRSSAINMKRNFNGAYPTKEHKRSKTLEPCDSIAIDDDDYVEVVKHDIHPKKIIKPNNCKNAMENDVYIIDEEPANCAGFQSHDNGTDTAEQTDARTFQSEQYSRELSPKFGGGIKKVLPTSRSRACKVDKNGSNARRMVQSMKAHIQHNVSTAGESGKNGQAMVKNSACKAQGFKLKDSVDMDRGDNLFNRLEVMGGDDADTRAGKGGTKRKSDDDDDSDKGSKTHPKKKLVGASGKAVWQMVTRKEKKSTEPIWEGNTKINRQKIVIKISKKLLTDQSETKEPENNAKRKEPEISSSRNGWKEGGKVEGTVGDRRYHGGIKTDGLEEEQEKREKIPLKSRGGKAASTSTGAVGRWSALPKAKSDKTGNDASRKSGRESGTNCRHPSDDLVKDLEELKIHGIKQGDLPWVRDLLETDHAECLSEACAALTKFMDSKDQKINLVVEMGFCPLLVKLLKSRSSAVISSALLAVSHIVSGNDYQTQAVLECAPLPLFCSFLSRHKHNVTLRKEACLALSNITAGTSQQIQHLVNDGLFPVLLSAMQHDEFQVMYEATWAVANATVNGSPEQIRYIVKQGFFQAFSEVLKHSDDTLVQIALDAMYNVLKLDTKPKKAGKLAPYCSQVKEYGGLQRIRSVRLTGSTVVKKKAYNMLTTFFPDF